LTIEVTELRKPNGDYIPLDSVFTDGSLIEVQSDTGGVDSIVVFPDPGLDYAVRQTINKLEGDIFLSEVLTIGTLFADNLGISNLSGLSYLSNLHTLGLDKNHISDISELSDLIGLELLFLDSNQISNINPLSGLINLQQLVLKDNLITDINTLTNLINILFLDLGNNEISDINPLVLNIGIGNGDEVWLTDNPLSVTSVDSLIPILEDRGVTVVF
jgi:Leucine-rich repeat (LRR) protein